MGLFWKRKSGDQFVSLKLNEPLPEKTGTTAVDTAETNGSEADASKPVAKVETSPSVPPPTSIPPAVEPVPTGAGPTPIPARPSASKATSVERRPEFQTREALQPQVSQAKPGVSVPARSPFATSVLGLNLSMEELQAQEAALEQEF